MRVNLRRKLWRKLFRRGRVSALLLVCADLGVDDDEDEEESDDESDEDTDTSTDSDSDSD